jgi:hypothetical protein
MKRGDILAEKIKDETLAKLSEKLNDEKEKDLAPTSSSSKLNCWTCGKYSDEAEHCYDCNHCNMWTLKKIFLHNRRYLRHLESHQIHKMGLTA